MKQSKAGDFLFGLLGMSILDGVLYWALGASRDNGLWFFVVCLAGLVFLIASAQTRRPYIALGIVVTAVIPLLSFGACLANLSGGSQH